MNEAKDGQPVPSQEGETLEPGAPQTMNSETAIGNPGHKSIAGTEKFSLAIERFSGLSSEMITLLMGLSDEISKSADELNAVRSAVDLKRKELEAFHETEKLAMALERQTEDLRRQKENLERLVADQRSAWEAEKVRRAREEREYDENRKILLEREEEEYKRNLAAEKLKARQMLEEELSAIRQRNLEVQESAEKDLLNREQVLKKKELEWTQLIQELEQFLSRLAKRTRSRIDIPAALFREESTAQPGIPASSVPISGFYHEESRSPGSGAESELDPHSEAILMWENTWEERDSALDDLKPIFGQDLAEEPGCSPSSSKELHILPGRKVEDSNPEPSAKREGIPLKFSPKKNNNKSDV